MPLSMLDVFDIVPKVDLSVFFTGTHDQARKSLDHKLVEIRRRWRESSFRRMLGWIRVIQDSSIRRYRFRQVNTVGG